LAFTVARSLTVAFAVALSLAYTLSAGRQAARFNERVAWLTFFAVPPALIAVILAMPTFREWVRSHRRHAEIEMWIEVGADRTVAPARVNEVAAIRGNVAMIRVVVRNHGDGTLTGGFLNIVTLSGAVLEPLDPPPRTTIGRPCQRWTLKSGGQSRSRSPTRSPYGTSLAATTPTTSSSKRRKSDPGQ